MNLKQRKIAASINPFSLSKSFQTLVDQIKQCSNTEELKRAYASMVKLNATQDCYLVNQFISAASTFCRVDYAVSAFTQIDNPNVFVYNAMIRGFVRCGYPFKALEWYANMIGAEVLPTSYTFSSLIKACTSISAVGFAENLHCQIWKNGLQSNLFVQTSFIDFYSSLGRFGDSEKVFDGMDERDHFAWTSMVSARARAGDMSSARKLFDEMPERSTVTFNTMIDGYARIGNVEAAELLFNQMQSRDLISWTSMIACYSQNKYFKEALAVFNDMISKAITPDEVTMATVISACAHLGALELGKQIHLYLMNNDGLNLDVYIGSALVDMYAKCGSLDTSLSVFYKLTVKNLFCWNSVIEGLAAHGYAREALTMLSMMERENIRPNRVTFISILSACAHAGLVEEGKERFYSMIHSYSILPDVEHYGCMVDMLSKSGLLEDAVELIRAMEMEANSVIWIALLNGCKLFRNLEIAEVAVEKLMVLEPDNSGYFNLLINMYAGENRWKEVAKIRAVMKELKVEKKFPGSSWIELGENVHMFSASANSHPDSDEIYLLLIELDGQLKQAGSVVDFGPNLLLF